MTPQTREDLLPAAQRLLELERVRAAPHHPLQQQQWPPFAQGSGPI